MKRKLRIISIVLAAFVLTLYISGCGNGKDTNSISASGTIESVNVTISSKTSGTINKINFKEGDRVKKGDLLIEISHDLLDIQLRQSEAGVDLANAQLKLLRSGARREDIKQSEDLVKQAKINMELALQDKERAEELYRQDATTKKLYDDAIGRYDLTVTQYNSTKENLAKVKTIIRPEEIEQAQANLKKAVSMVDLLKQNIEDCKVYAPSDGFVSKKFIEEGENAVMGGSLLRLSNLETVNLVIYIPETELAKVKLGQEADITIDAFKDKNYKGKIIFISPEAEFTPKNIQTPDERTKLVFAIKIEIPNPQFELKPGLPADAKINFQ
ncbi:MAG TPA: efflux RND transporter periplasmic adaptor subunit [Ignavibacteria bacterium]|nr:efflux RND transporter periplasmic adaptor subunit [Ignavibacteria bacterium]HMQ98260.1 efflux RND transporter periplasmic adaptor subunit [Ignavibacteria bacterium]